MTQSRFIEALKDYNTALSLSPDNPKYIHAKGITYEALAASVEKKHGSRRRFDFKDADATPREDGESLTRFLLKDFLDYSELAI